MDFEGTECKIRTYIEPAAHGFWRSAGYTQSGTKKCPGANCPVGNIEGNILIAMRDSKYLCVADVLLHFKTSAPQKRLGSNIGDKFRIFWLTVKLGEG